MGSQLVELAASAPHVDTTDDATIPAPGAASIPQISMSRDEYIARTAIALDHIHAGDIYQGAARVSGRRTRLSVADLDVYRRLRAINPLSIHGVPAAGGVGGIER